MIVQDIQVNEQLKPHLQTKITDNKRLHALIINPFQLPANLFIIGLNNMIVMLLMQMSKGVSISHASEYLGFARGGRVYTFCIKRMKSERLIERIYGNNLRQYDLTDAGHAFIRVYVDNLKLLLEYCDSK